MSFRVTGMVIHCFHWDWMANDVWIILIIAWWTIRATIIFCTLKKHLIHIPIIEYGRNSVTDSSVDLRAVSFVPIEVYFILMRIFGWVIFPEIYQEFSFLGEIPETVYHTLLGTGQRVSWRIWIYCIDSSIKPLLGFGWQDDLL